MARVYLTIFLGAALWAVLGIATPAVALAGAPSPPGRTCSEEELMSELQKSLAPPAVETLLAAALEPAGEPAPAPTAPVCAPGFDDDDRCGPQRPLPGPSGGFSRLVFDAFVLVRPPVLPGASSIRLALLDSRAGALAPGHARRLERPPRSV